MMPLGALLLTEIPLAKSVNHPGTKAQPFLRPALAFGRVILRTNVPLAVQRAFKKDPSGATLQEELDKVVKSAAFAVQAAAVRRCPVDKGLLRQSINVVRRGELFYTVGTNVKYGKWVEEGTDAHVIRPKNKKALAFGTRRTSNRKRKSAGPKIEGLLKKLKNKRK